MKFNYGYKCKKCGKIFAKKASKLPFFCPNCGNELVKERYLYNLNIYGEETQETNIFGGYDYLKNILAEGVKKIKIYKKHFFSPWEEWRD